MIDRRTLILGAAVLPACATNFPGLSTQARALYRDALVIDGNIAPYFDRIPPLSAEALAINRGSGLTACKATIGGFGNNYAQTNEEIAFYNAILAAHRETFSQIRSVADILTAKRENKVGILFSFEGVAMLEDRLARIGEFRAQGVLVMQLSYNLPSPFGAGVMSDPALGLTELGRQAVAEMNRLGVALDLSHANERTTAEAMAASAKPVLMTHGGCRAVYDHPRNKSDAHLRALAEKGGVLGIYDLPYLTASPRQPTLDDYMAHMAHALDVVGEEHVGIGSDTSFSAFPTDSASVAAFEADVRARRQSGVSAPGEDRMPYTDGLNTERRCEIIADALLRRGYPARAAEKVLGGNFIRAFEAIWLG